MTNIFYSCYFFLAFFFSIHVLVFSFTVDLIHRDSQQSPFYDPKATDMERMNNVFRRSMLRAARFTNAKNSPNSIQTQISSSFSSGEYLMKLLVGTPPVPVLGIADTGSDLTWFQCKPCTECYPQDSPLFDPRKSSTYRRMTCKSRHCHHERNYCNATTNHCKYQISYLDSSHTIGDMAAETLTFGSGSRKTIPIPGIIFGCGFNNTGNFGKRENGIIGLGPGELSLVNQLSHRSAKRKFSYCLVPFESNFNITSKISFGESLDMTCAHGVVSTALQSEMYYYVTLESISVGNMTFPFRRNSGMVNSTAGSFDKFNMIIDSGTTLTYLPHPLYDDLDQLLRKLIKTQATSYPDENLNLCYLKKDNVSVPIIKLNFAGAVLELPMSSTFVEVSKKLICFSFVPTDDLAMLGNLSQQNLLIEYDIDRSKISFKPTDCTKQ